VHILDTEAKGLVEKLALLSPAHRQQIVSRSCLFAAQNIEGLEPDVRSWLDSIDRRTFLPDETITELKQKAEEADDAYFQAQEEGDFEKSQNYFSTARLLTAIVDNHGDSSLETAADAVYELCKTQDDPSAIIKFVESEIDAVPHNQNDS
jgi:hypothetical protein